ncbi:TPA: four helix bundle protein [Candidatus Poribacteria bacterium]|nr:four helix bundle protein [Candidatus Poribacteria bacterium]HEX29585.1 four helix bundle protein [Candidatus Poribacteria bacterium]
MGLKGIESYRDLQVWQKAMNLVVAVYKVTQGFPQIEQYGLTAQSRRAAVSVPANIAEGHGRRHRAEYLNFLSVARGSLMELETHLMIAHRLNYLTDEMVDELLGQTAEIGRMLNGLMTALTRPQRQPRP